MRKRVALTLAVCFTISLLAGCKDTGSAAENNNNTTQQPAADASAPKDQNGSKIIMKIAHAAKDGSARDLGAETIKEVVEAESGGAIEVQIYPNSQLGGSTDLIQGMQTDTIEMVILPSSFMGSFQPLTTLMDIPYLFPTEYEKLDKIEHGEAAAALLATTEEIGVTTLDIWHTGYKAFTANSKLEMPEDFKSLKFRVMPSQILFAQYEALGATAVSMDFSECYNALQTGAIDGQENPLDTTTDMNFQEVQKYCTLSNHGVLDQFIMVSSNWWDGLSEENKAAIMKGIDAGRQVCVDKTHESESVSRQKILDAGVEIHELTDEELEAWKEALAVCKDTYIENYGEKGEALLKLFEEELAALEE